MARLEHNFDEFAQALTSAPNKYESQVQNPLGEFISKSFDVAATQDFMQEGPEARFDDNYPSRPRGLPGGLRKLSHRLARAVGGAFNDRAQEANTEVQTTERGITWFHEILVPYALIHEEGGTIPAHRVPVTQDMQAFFWAKAFETGMNRFNKWRNLALGAQKKDFFEIPSVTIPARPYAQPALNKILPKVREHAGQLLDTFIENTLNT